MEGLFLSLGTPIGLARPDFPVLERLLPPGYARPEMIDVYLVGGWPTPLKNMKVNGKDYPIY